MFYLFALISMIASSTTPAGVPAVPTVGAPKICGIGDPNATLIVHRPEDKYATLRLGSFECPQAPGPVCGDMDILIILDRSGTMSQGYSIGGETKQKIEWAKIAAEQFAQQMYSNPNTGSHIRIGVISFGSHLKLSDPDSGKIESNIAWVHQRLTTAEDSVLRGIRDVRHILNGTCISCGIRRAFDEFTTNPFHGNPNASRNVILLSDGMANALINGDYVGDEDGSAQREAIEEAVNVRNTHNAIFYVLGYGSAQDEDTLQSIAGSAPGVYIVARDPEDWIREFDRIGKSICERSI